MPNAAVELLEIEPDIIQVTMQDKAHKNAFSKELTDGLMEAFTRIKKSSVYKAVILTGYGHYFASGGTQEGLLRIQQGITKFTEDRIYSLALECDIPVISAMQGHGIGGGFVMGLFSDFVILSKESVYTANFMKYGFTPGMGATFIVPEKLGASLGHEMLLNGGHYRGGDLEKRGVPFPVLPRQEVLDYAQELARELAEKPRNSLITLKRHLVTPFREQLPAVIEKELIMHDETFHDDEVKKRITTMYGV
ncbi:polyketide synthase [Bacillus velezensis]|uniref:polyketide synthase n=1 Tax=Bacillus velezensis TaxID=492670 RepID=UPI0005EBEAD6|nr:polyketide synthase [Bacillus velezensis]KJR70320.1 polyketide biosynthesis enoyl-CoA hydratase [Bacillus velezensis]